MEVSAKNLQDEKHDYLGVARTLRNKLDGLIALEAVDLGTQEKFLLDASKELDLVLANKKITHRHDEFFICTHSCCEHVQVLNPSLWSTLPMELLHRVFAKLPIPDICRLKSLSKELKLSLESSSSQFTQALKESSSKMLAGVTSGGLSSYWLHVLDGRNNRWHPLYAELRVRGSANRRMMNFSSTQFWVHMNGAAEGGLVCYVEKDPETDVNIIYVMNPITMAVNRLPNLNLLKHSNLTMMRIVVDRDTYHYKVIVVTHDLLVGAEVYDSEVQKWTKPKPSLGRIFGIAYNWTQNYHSVWGAHELGPCAYDCCDGKYYGFEQELEKWLGKEVISYALMEDRLFVLYWDEKEDAAFISEYYVPRNATSWVKKKSHSCFPGMFWQSDGPQMTGKIYACCGFLFVFQEHGWLGEADPPKKQESGWIYDLDTCKWHALPCVPWWSTVHLEAFRIKKIMEQFHWDLQPFICELHWNIQP